MLTGRLTLQVPRSQYLYSLNASIVALVADPSIETGRHGDDEKTSRLPLFLDAAPDANCIGLGMR